MSDEKTEDATPKKLRDARKKGEAPKSPDVNTALAMMASTVLLTISSWIAGEHLRKLFALVLGEAWQAKSVEKTIAIAYDMVLEAILMSLPYLVTAIFMALIASFAQVGIQISFEPLVPKFDKLNPGQGIKKLFSVKSVIDLVKMIVKAIALGAVLYAIIEGLIPLLVGSATQSPEAIVDIAWRSLIKLMGAATVVFIILGPGDYAIQLWQFKKDQRMSKDEIKREYKESEGNPEVKQQRKQLARELANSAPQKRVGNSNVVVNNPTHYSVALRYVPGETALPIVMAKGHDAEAAQIRELAEQYRVPMVTNPPLARALYKVELDEPVPEELFEAVAAVFRWVQMIDTLSAGLGALPPPQQPNKTQG